MAKAFSVASWNIEHLGDSGPAERITNVVGFLDQQNADVIAVYEVEGKYVWRHLMDGLPGYSWFITEGQNTQEILLGTASSSLESPRANGCTRPGTPPVNGFWIGPGI